MFEIEIKAVDGHENELLSFSMFMSADFSLYKYYFDQCLELGYPPGDPLTVDTALRWTCSYLVAFPCRTAFVYTTILRL